MYIVHFTFREIVFLATDPVTIGFLLGPVLSETFMVMVYLERSLVSLLAAELSLWKRYVDDTITFIKIGTVDPILFMLNTFFILIFNSHMTQNIISFLRCYAV